MNEVFQALSDPTRREILRLLQGSDMTAGEIADRFPLAKSTLSGHFNVLKHAGLIVAEKNGTTVVYSLNVSAVEQALAAVMNLLDVGKRVRNKGQNMKRTWRGELVQLLPIAAMFVVAALCWSHVPDHIPVHWNWEGKADRYGGKFDGLVLLPLVVLGIYLLLLVLPLFDPGRANYRTFAGAYNAIRLAITLFFRRDLCRERAGRARLPRQHEHRGRAGDGGAVHCYGQCDGEDSPQLVRRRAHPLDPVEQTVLDKNASTGGLAVYCHGLAGGRVGHLADPLDVWLDGRRRHGCGIVDRRCTPISSTAKIPRA